MWCGRASPRRCRASGVHRPCWWTPAPTPSARPRCWSSSPRWAPPTWPPASAPGPAGTAATPSVGLLSIGEEPSKGTPLVKETHALLAAENGFEFVGNLEGRDLLPSPADVIVTDGFTGNVALKTLEGSLRFLFDTLLGVFGTDDATREASSVLLPHLLPLAAEFEPENTGGAMLLGTNGICVISHGSSNATAMMNAVLVAHECATRGLADQVAAAVRFRRTSLKSQVRCHKRAVRTPEDLHWGACQPKPTASRALLTATGCSS